MRKIYTIFISLILLQMTVFSQVEITTIIPQTGDNLTYMEADNLEGFDPGPAGTNITWDYSAGLPAGNIQSDYQIISPEDADGAEYFPSNSMVWHVNFGDTALLNFYQGNTPGAWTDHGYFNVIPDGSAMKTFTDNLISYLAPLNFEDTGSDSYAGTLSFNGEPVFSFTGTSNYTVDGWGKLIFPDATFNQVLRIKYIEDEAQSIAGLTINTINTNYAYYSDLYPVPVLHVSFSEVYFMGELTETRITATYLTSYNGQILEVAEYDNRRKMQIYPNPASTYIILGFDSAESLDLHIIDAAGHVVRTERIYRDTRIDTGDLKPGFYIARLSRNGAYFSQNRFIINR